MSGTNLSVWSGEGTACIRVSGRANFSASIDFKKAIYWLSDNGYHQFLLDLTDCVLMDSTFVGVLAGLGRTFESPLDHSPHKSIEILNPNDRVTDLLDNLGVTSVFQIVQGQPPDPQNLTELHLPATPTTTREELARTCLQAHKNLIQANPANAEKFKDVTSTLSKEIQGHKNKP